MTSTSTTRSARRRKSGDALVHGEGLQEDVDLQEDMTTMTAVHDQEEEEEDVGHETLGSVLGALGGLGVLAGGVALAKKLKKRARTPQIPEVRSKSEI